MNDGANAPNIHADRIARRANDIAAEGAREALTLNLDLQQQVLPPWDAPTAWEVPAFSSSDLRRDYDSSDPTCPTAMGSGVSGLIDCHDIEDEIVFLEKEVESAQHGVRDGESEVSHGYEVELRDLV